MPTLNILIATGADDGQYRSGGTFFNNNNITTVIGNSGAAMRCFFRFQNVTIPAGATITAASIRFIATANQSSTTCSLVARGELDTNPAAVSSGADGNARTKTSASVSWNEPAWTTGNSYSTPDIATIIQEIIDQGGWSSGNAMQLFVEDNASTSTAFRSPRSYDGSTTDCARLDITYTDPPTGNRRRRLLLAA